MEQPKKGRPHEARIAQDMNGEAMSIKLGKQLSLNLSYVGLAICLATRGPTLLELSEVYNTNMKTMSLSFVSGSAGAIFGSVSASILFNKLTNFSFLLVFSIVLVLGIGQAVLASLGYLWLMFIDAFVVGLTFGMMHSGLNVTCLRIWRGHKGGASYMHSLHLFFALGLFLAPVICKPFLRNRGVTTMHNVTETAVQNGSLNAEVLTNSSSTTEDAEEESQLTTLYPLTGLIIVVISLLPLVFGIKEIFDRRNSNRRKRDMVSAREEAASLNNNPKKVQSEEMKFKETRGLRAALYSLMFVFFFCYACTEYGIVNFLAPFGVKSKLGLTYQESAVLMLFYLGPLLAMRVLIILVAMVLRPVHILYVNLTFCLVGSLTNVIVADSSLTATRVAFALLGTGTSSMFGNSVMWIESYVMMDATVTSIAAFGGCLGALFSPMVLGLTIDDRPMSLPYMILATTCTMWIFSLIVLPIGNRIVAMEKKLKAEREVEMEDMVQNEDAGENLNEVKS